MARARSKTKAKKGAKRAGPRLPVLAAYAASFGLSGLAALISPPLAAFGIAVSFLTALAHLELHRRRYWEQAAEFRFKTIGERLDDVERGLGSALRRNDTAKPRPPPAPPPLRATKPGAAMPPEAPAEDYEDLSDAVIRELMQVAVRAGEINVFAQPVMRLPQRKARFYEVYARLRVRPGSYIPAGRYLDLARADGLVADIDQLMLAGCLRAIEDSAHLESAAPFFLNIAPGTLADRAFMKRLLAFLAKNRALSGRLVFEIHQRDFLDMRPAILEILRGLGRLGCALSIDHVESFDFDLKFLQILKVRFVKFKAAALLRLAREENGATGIWRLKRRLEGNGIGFVVEKIEDEFTLTELLDFDIHYGQGYLLGKPAPLGVLRPAAAERKIA